MNCELNIVISKELLESIYKKYINENVEWSGTISFKQDDYNENNKNYFYYSENKHNNNKSGNNKNVRPELSLINYHTHPLICYQEQKTIYGWISGEDISATILLSLFGNKGHITLCLEGVYFLKIVNEFTEFLKKQDISYREKIIKSIEEYFKETHSYRCKEHIKKENKKGREITPYSFLNLVNNFKLSDLIKSEKVKPEKNKNNLCKKDIHKYFKLDKDTKYILQEIQKKNKKIFNKKVLKCDFIETKLFLENPEKFIKVRETCIKEKCVRMEDIKLSDNIYLKLQYKTEESDNCSIEYLDKLVKK